MTTLSPDRILSTLHDAATVEISETPDGYILRTDLAYSENGEEKLKYLDTEGAT